MIALGLAVALATAQLPPATIRRFALVAGANDGGSDRVMLRYANSDARAVSAVLAELGGVSAQDTVVVEDPSAPELLKAFDALSARVQSLPHGPGARTEVLFYYSGHSDETGLLLKGEKISYAALRARLDALRAEVRIAVLDSCASGALSRSKGGVARPSFLVDASSSLSGHAFLTSASEDESAQESEQLKASIFTHFLVSGLRGAADSSRDGRVTLSEAYQYAFAETLARTTSTRTGPQRPGYDIALVGTGDLVLTDVRASSARLVLDASVGGRVYVLNGNGGLVVEVAKSKGKPTELGLEPGPYRVVIDGGDRAVGEARVVLAKGESRSVGANGLATTTLETTVLRGGAPKAHLPLDLAFVYPLSLVGVMDPPPRVNVAIGVITSRVGAIDGALVSSVGAWVDEAVTGAAVSGVFLKTGGLRGVAVSGVALLNTGDSTGVQASLVNLSKGKLVGLQAALLNLSVGETHGLQLGLVEVSTGPLWGAQLGLVNFAPQAHAAQVGLINIGGELDGAQVGLINIASRVSATQVGLINVARTSNAPIGLINILSEGTYKLAVWSNETSVANLAVKAGGEHVYSALTAGLNPRADGGRPAFSYGLGVGVRASFGRGYGELEASVESVTFSSRGYAPLALSTGLRLNVGYQLFERMAVFAGPQVHTLVSFSPENELGQLSPWGFNLGPTVRLVPGVVAGVQLL